MEPFNFPKWTNTLRPWVATGLGLGGVYLIFILYYAGAPRTTSIGYSPVQPVPFSHARHGGDLGMDCRYCHTTVENAAFAAIPPAQTCMNCHKNIRGTDPRLQPVRDSVATGNPVQWIKVHTMADYVFFNHSAHVTRGVPCSACHGRLDQMEQVTRVTQLSMGWCLDCHRNPENFLRPVEAVTKMDWTPPEDQRTLGLRLMKENNIKPSTDCSTCHR